MSRSRRPPGTSRAGWWPSICTSTSSGASGLDARRAASRAPWGRVLEGARACGGLRPLGYALALLDALLGIASPSGVRGAPPALNALERSFVRLVAQRSGV